MSRSTNPISMIGWMCYRHIPYQIDEEPYALARDLVTAHLPKKEFFEVIAMVEAIRSFVDPEKPVYDCCSGHGLLGMLLGCDPRVPNTIVLDRAFPPNHYRLRDALVKHRPSLGERLKLVEGHIEEHSGFEVGNYVGAHACGLATDGILDMARRTRSRFFVMTCCIANLVAKRYGLERVNGQEAEINRRRLEWMKGEGYTVQTVSIDSRITPMNLVLCGWPSEEEMSPKGGLEASLLPGRMPPKLQEPPLIHRPRVFPPPLE